MATKKTVILSYLSLCCFAISIAGVVSLLKPSVTFGIFVFTIIGLIIAGISYAIKYHAVFKVINRK